MGAARGALQLEVHDQSLQSAETCGTSNIFFGQSGQSGQFQSTCVLGRSMFPRKVYSVAQKWLSEMSIHNSYPSSRDLNMSSTVGVAIPEAGFALPADSSRFVVLLIARAKQGGIPNQAAMLSLPA